MSSIPISYKFITLLVLTVAPLYYFYQIRVAYIAKLNELQKCTVKCLGGIVSLNRVLGKYFSLLALYFYFGSLSTIMYYATIIGLTIVTVTVALLLSGMISPSSQLHVYSLAVTFGTMLFSIGVMITFNSLVDTLS